MRRSLIYLLVAEISLVSLAGILTARPGTIKPLRAVVDLNIGDSQSVTLDDGNTVTIKLIDVRHIYDNLTAAVRDAVVTVEINGAACRVHSANYTLPVNFGGVQVDCPVTKGYYEKNRDSDSWGLEKDARIRLWPAGSPWITPGTFLYPANQVWFASMTQMANEPTYVDGGEFPRENIYYHNGLDIGGAEAMTEVFAATDAKVISKGNMILDGYDKRPVAKRYDVVYLLDDRGWFYRYSHLNSIDPLIIPGSRVKMGQKVGILGKEGGSGGWTHLHFEISAMQPSGKWGTEEGYAYLWQTYVEQHKPKVIAVARPHRAGLVGEEIILDASKSMSMNGSALNYFWTLSDGKSAAGPVQTMRYDKPGEYSEIVKIADVEGNVDYDFVVVQIKDLKDISKGAPAIHASYYPSLNIKPGDPVTFKVRTFNAIEGADEIDFGDGSPIVKLKSVECFHPEYTGFMRLLGFDLQPRYLNPDGYAITVHQFENPGYYIVTVKRVGDYGFTATAHLDVRVGK